MRETVTLPALGEKANEAEVLVVLVAVGDRVARDQALIEVETDKAAVEVPSPVDGVVRSVAVKVGDTIHVGQPILEVETEAEAPTTAPATPPEHSPTLVHDEPPAAPRPAPAPPSVAQAAVTPTPADAAAVAAAPSVRRLARELGIDVADVPPSTPGGRLSAEDVMRYARSLIERKGTASEQPVASAGTLELPDFSRFGSIERERMSGVRRKTAQAMTRSWLAVPHVTQFDRADITELERARKHLAARVEAAGSRLTLTAVIIRALAMLLAKFPKFNASVDTDREEVIFKRYYNIGVAVDTDHGLLVPVIRNADRKSVVEIGRELTELSERARARKSRPDDLQGANLTVTNLGGLGTTYFSPLVNWPEVAVLGVGRANKEAVYVDGAFAPRLILPLSVSYDHRLIDGADAARFLRAVAEILENPLALALEG